MENLNAEQIKKAMECCQTPNADDCEKCEYRRRGNTDNFLIGCCNILVADALSLITSQEQRIKELTEKIVQLLSQADCDKAEINLLRKHIESLGETIEMQEQEVDSLTATVKVRGETIEKLQFSVTDISEHNRKLTEENEKLKLACAHYSKELCDEANRTAEYFDKLEADNERLRADKEELTKESKKWEQSYDCMHSACRELSDECHRLNEENERLERICHSYVLQYGTATDKEVFLKKERADTVKKMQERIRKHATNGYPRKVRLDVIDQIAKEMLEGNDGT